MTYEDSQMEMVAKNTNTRKNLTKSLVSMLRRAKLEKRLTCAMVPTINLLQKDASIALFCILPQTRQGDTALHIHSVLLQAFCYENEINIIKVDSAKKLGDIIAGPDAASPRDDYSCVLVHRSQLSERHEKELATFCDTTAEQYPPPVIQLPET